MKDDKPNGSDDARPEPQQADIDLGERSIKSVGFPDTERPATDPFSGNQVDTTSGSSTDAAVSGPAADGE